nr:hypothetical protein [Providencia rustigianii]
MFAVQSIHKMLPSLSIASMIHVKKWTYPINFDDFNDSFMMHGTTSPYYLIISSNKKSAWGSNKPFDWNYGALNLLIKLTSHELCVIEKQAPVGIC